MENIKDLIKYAKGKSEDRYLTFLKSIPPKFRQLPSMGDLWKETPERSYTEFLRGGKLISKEIVKEKNKTFLKKGGLLTVYEEKNKDKGFLSYLETTNTYSDKKQINNLSTYITYLNKLNNDR
jgi:hypothetical protein